VDAEKTGLIKILLAKKYFLRYRD